ncbi:unnamed protein product [Mytilus edulis]|uniref:Uncharacterized protein n=1 Tax=Mytilus edulis TaxID=6550 RepID=A0A8S3UJJ6_MYTED|nr:unnamed protein product [Mytilus edulis]
MAANVDKQTTHCPLQKFAGGRCGFSATFSKDEEHVKLSECTKNISNHLKFCKLPSGHQSKWEADVSSEGHLISYRCGLFSFQPDLKVCPVHRYNLGLLWKPSRSCANPDHKGNKKVTKVVITKLSRNLFSREGIFIPVGAGLCSSCFVILNGKYNEEQIELENVSPDCIDKEEEESLDQDAALYRPRKQKGDHQSELFDMDQSQSTIEDFDSQVSDKNNEKLQLLSMIANKYKTQLQNLIPEITVWRIDQARRHFQFYNNGPGSFSVDAKEKLHRLRMDPVKLEHALDFFFYHQFIQVSSFGMRTVKLEQETVSIPQVIRTSCNSELVNMYITICKEQDFSPLSSFNTFKILSSCSAAKKTNLRGLDNIAADGNTAFDLLINVTKELVNKEVLDRDDSDEILSKLKKSKIYLKTDYKLHVQKNDRCADHCINWALSDTKEKEYAVDCHDCDHLHDLV